MNDTVKIATVTLNPAIDRSIYFEGEFKKDGLNRVDGAKINAGGKGINVSRALKRLGADSTAYGFCGGKNGEILCEILNDEGIDCNFTQTLAETRVNIKIVDSKASETEINENGGPVTESEFDDLLAKLEKCDEKIVAIGGSAPRGLGNDVYRILVEKLKALGKKVAADVSGEPLKNAISAKPYLIKPNKDEFSYLLGYRPDEEKIIGEAYNFYSNTGIEIILTMGKKGAVYAGEKGFYRIINPEIKPKGFSGAGDTFLASYLYASASGCDVEKALKFASAASLSKVELEGANLPDIEHINKNIGKIEIIKL